MMPPARRLDDGERPVVGGADDGDLLRIRSEPLQAAGEQVDVDVGGGHHHRADALHGALAAGGAQHPQGLERQQRSHAVRHDVDAPAARRSWRWR